MIRQDDRTAEQKKTHTVLITATDRFMSGWGACKDGISKCAWACKPEHAEAVYQWVNARKEMKYVNIVCGAWYPKNAKHVHIYLVHDEHMALNKQAVTV
jgi:hypothetical protein